MIILPSFKGIFYKAKKQLGILVGGNFITYGGSLNYNISGLNSDGTLDDNFSIGSGFSGGSPVTCDIQSDGKILIGGNFTSYNGTARNRIVRLNTDGTLDTNFTIGTGFNQIVNKVMIQPDGKIITVGTFSNYNGTGINGIARLNSDGTRDTSLNSGGFSGAVNTFDIQSDSKIVVGGGFGNYAGVSQSRITRLNSDGTRDTNFSIGTGFNAGSAVNAIVIQSDGKILIGGTFTSYNGTAINRIIRLNTDGTIDNSFTVGTGFNNTVNTITIQSDGKIIVGGQFTNYAGTSRYAIARLNSDGTNDATFNIGTGFNSGVNAISIQSDGKIIVGGSFIFYTAISNNRIVRLNTDGTRDTSFSVGTGFDSTINMIKVNSTDKILVLGAFTFYNGLSTRYMTKLNFSGEVQSNNLNVDNSISVITKYSNNKIMIGGNLTSYNGTSINRLARLNLDETRDTSFSIGTGFNNTVSSIAVQSDGKILAGGSFTTYAGISRNRIVRLNTGGSFDTSFIIGAGFNSTVSAITIQSDGKILIGGSFTSYSGTSINRIIRLNTDGTIDSSFTVGTGFNNTVSAIVIQSDGKILSGGNFTNYNGTNINRIVRLNSDGTIDNTFTVGTGFNNLVNAISIQSDGKIIIGGVFTLYNGVSSNRIVRLNSDGTHDTSFSIGTGFNATIFALKINTDGKIIAGGNFTNYNGTNQFRIAILNSDGSLDLNFNGRSHSDINTILII